MSKALIYAEWILFSLCQEYNRLKRKSFLFMFVVDKKTDMGYRYIYNEEGQKEAVIVPIGEWESLRKSGHQERKSEKVRLADMTL